MSESSTCEPSMPRASTGAETWRRMREASDARAVAVDPPPRHRPRVAVLSCSDARVPPSLVFDRPAGELFAVRIAGNTASPAAIASLEYAVEHLGVELLVVLGHSGCGAVAAALDGTCDGPLEPIVSPLCSLARRSGSTDALALTELNVATTIDDLTAGSAAIAAARAEGRLAVRGAIYDLATGRVIDVATNRPDPAPAAIPA